MRRSTETLVCVLFMRTRVPDKVRSLLFTSIGHFANDGVFLLFALLIVYYHESGVSVALLGALGIAYNVIDGIASPRIGAFVGRSDRAAYMALGIALEGASLVLFAASFVFSAYIYPLLVSGLVALGIGQTFYHPIGSSVLRHVYGKTAPTAMGINGSMGSVGRAAFPLLITFAIVALGIPLGLGLMAVLVMALAIVIYAGLRVFEHESYSRDHSEPTDDIDYGTARRTHSRFISALTWITLLRSMFVVGTTTFIGEYINGIFHSNVIVGLFLTVSFLPAIFGQIIFGRITERRGGLYAFSITTAALVPIFVLFMLTQDLASLMLAYAAFTFFAYTGFPVILGFIGQVVPQRHMTAISAHVWGIGTTMGAAAGLAVATALLDLGFGIGQTFWVLLAFGAAAIALLPTLRK